jgi:UDP-2,3-diacylglucosamine hydrolase
MYGNRDFLIGKKFLRATGCELLADEEKILLYGKPLLLMHGDLLCIEDVAYLKARKLGKNKLAQTIFLLMPLNYRRRYANRMRAKSKRHTSTAPRAIMDVTQSEVERIMQKHNVTSLIHGHTHRPQTHYFPLQHQTAERIVLGAWHDGANGLVWDERGNKEWVKFNF